ncbi:MAG: hypothetical protein ACLUHG_01990 [Sutterella wadsworthensis]
MRSPVLKRAVPCGLSRAVAGDIDACAEAPRRRVVPHPHLHRHVRHSREGQVAQDFDRILEMGVEAVRRARNTRTTSNFPATRGPHADRPSLPHGEAAIDAGATTVNIPDTVGYTVLEEFGGIITTLFNRVPNIDRAIISVHCPTTSAWPRQPRSPPFSTARADRGRMNGLASAYNARSRRRHGDQVGEKSLGGSHGHQLEADRPHWASPQNLPSLCP